MSIILTPEAISMALLIFILRVINSGVGTVRLVVMARGRYWLTAILGFIEALIFAYVTVHVVNDFSNVIILASYCLGFSVGTYVGMLVEARFVTSYVRVHIITREKGKEIAQSLRDMGHGVTEMTGTGGTGEVSMMDSIVLRRDVNKMLKAVYQINPAAFVTLEEARSVQHGWMRPPSHQK
jgi:uncharacterized protein YebE (UPF0316 family)